jgi:NAD(P)-dependent dehydrogenase (short-subunit alcohol dehydrogenase family)
MNNKTILITGATDGIGKQTALELSKLGHNIILHGRSENKCKSIQKWIEENTESDNVHYLVSDFSRLNDVRRMADELKKRFVKVDVLINNAGVYMNELKYTDNEYESTFAINHLAPFLLTNLLLDQFNDGGRIINVSSIAHTRAVLDWENLNAERGYDHYQAYAISKLANVLFTYELAKKLEDRKISVNALHPGVITTKLLKTGFNIEGASLSEGAATSVYLASSPEVEGVNSKYFVRCEAVESSPDSYSEENQKRMWELSEQLFSL